MPALMTTQDPSSQDLVVLLQAAAHGDPEARARLDETCVQPVAARVRRWIVDQFHDRRALLVALTESDAVTEAVAAVVAGMAPRSFNTLTALQDHVARVAHHRVVELVLAEAATEAIRSHDPSHDGLAPAELQAAPRLPADRAAELREKVLVTEDLLGRFSDRRRRLLELRAIEEVPYVRLADELGYASEDSARQALCQARTRLRQLQRDAGIARPARS